MSHSNVILDGRSLDLAQVGAVADAYAKVSLAPAAVARMAVTRRVVDDIVASGAVVYGVTTGFGKLSEIVREPENLYDYDQTNNYSS